MKTICFLLLFPALAFGAEATNEAVEKSKQQIYILKLEKMNAELQMELYMTRYLNARTMWKEKLKALGEPDPDEQAETKEKTK